MLRPLHEKLQFTGQFGTDTKDLASMIFVVYLSTFPRNLFVSAGNKIRQHKQRQGFHKNMDVTNDELLFQKGRLLTSFYLCSYITQIMSIKDYYTRWAGKSLFI